MSSKSERAQKKVLPLTSMKNMSRMAISENTCRLLFPRNVELLCLSKAVEL